MKERMPEAAGWYLCTLDSAICGEGTVFTTMCEFTDGSWDEYEIEDIIAWMPLPEPYRPAAQSWKGSFLNTFLGGHND